MSIRDDKKLVDRDLREQQQTVRSVRRAVLKGSLVGAGALTLSSGEWVKPVVNAVVLPVHAQTSAPFSVSYFGSGIALPIVRQSRRFSPLDLLIDSAVAQSIPTVTLRVSVASAQTYEVCMYVGFEQPLIACGELNIDGSDGSLEKTQDNCLEDLSDTFTARIDAISDQNVSLFVNLNNGLRATIGAGDGVIPDVVCAG